MWEITHDCLRSTHTLTAIDTHRTSHISAVAWRDTTGYESYRMTQLWYLSSRLNAIMEGKVRSGGTRSRLRSRCSIRALMRCYFGKRFESPSRIRATSTRISYDRRIYDIYMAPGTKRRGGGEAKHVKARSVRCSCGTTRGRKTNDGSKRPGSAARPASGLQRSEGSSQLVPVPRNS